jgi:hypothetical protein
MAYSALTPETRIEEAQDGRGFKIYDKSSWDGESDHTTSALVSIVYIDDDENIITYDDIDLCDNGGALYASYLNGDGALIESSDILLDGAAIDEIFPDGYYEITIKFNDGSYAPGAEPYYKNTQAFLAKYRCMKRTMPAVLLEWPITDDIRRKNYDIYTLGLYLDAAEDAADLGKKVQFRKFIALIRGIVDYYSIPDPF